MSSFKDFMQQDIDDVFFEEFGEKHIVDGEEMITVVDENELLDREKNKQTMVNGIYKRQILLYVKASDFGKLPKINRTITLDGKVYLIKNATNEDGVYTIHLEVNGD